MNFSYTSIIHMFNDCLENYGVSIKPALLYSIIFNWVFALTLVLLGAFQSSNLSFIEIFYFSTAIGIIQSFVLTSSRKRPLRHKSMAIQSKIVV